MAGTVLPRIRPGQALSATYLNDLAEAAELGTRGYVANGYMGGQGISIALPDRDYVWAQVTVAGSGLPPAHGWQEVLDDGTNAFAQTLEGLEDNFQATPLYEVNGASLAVGTIVRAWKGIGDYYLCEASLSSASSLRSVPLCTTPPVAGQLLQAVRISPPAGLTATATLGGTLSAGTTYGYVVTAVNSTGETVASTQATVTPAGSSTAVTLSWSAQPLATGYRLYRTSTPGTYSSPAFLAALASNTLTSFLDDGNTVLTAGAPLAVGTALEWCPAGPGPSAPFVSNVCRYAASISLPWNGFSSGTAIGTMTFGQLLTLLQQTVEYRSLGLAPSSTVSDPFCFLDPTACCPGSVDDSARQWYCLDDGDGGGGAGCCNIANGLINPLHATLSSTDCPCLDGIAVTLNYQNPGGVTPYFFGNAIVSPTSCTACGSEPLSVTITVVNCQLTLALACTDTDGITPDASSGKASLTTISCAPLSLSAAVPMTVQSGAHTICGGTVTVTVTG